MGERAPPTESRTARDTRARTTTKTSRCVVLHLERDIIPTLP